LKKILKNQASLISFSGPENNKKIFKIREILRFLDFIKILFSIFRRSFLSINIWLILAICAAIASML
jgi:hypothetical protein